MAWRFMDDNPFILEEYRPLSHSLLWQLQRRYFEQQGLEAWRQGIVPHYITSNPFIANAYSKVVFGFLRDCWTAATAPPNPAFRPLDLNRPIYLLELGAGSGRFAYHFLKKFLPFFTRSPLRHLPIKYVMSDFAEQTVNDWLVHPYLRPFVEQGYLDFARFDAEQDETIRLHVSGETLAPDTIHNPLVVLANYFFDGIPQDAFYVKDGRLHESQVRLLLPQAEANLNDPALLERVKMAYQRRPINPPYYDDPDLDEILFSYPLLLDDTAVMFPCSGIRCIRRLRRLTNGRLLLLSGDKGYHHEDLLLGRQEPGISFHGSFSMMVNYHALARYVLNESGQVLHISRRHVNLDVAAFLFGRPPGDYSETKLAFDQAIEQAGPDDFFTFKKGVEPHYGELTLEQALAHLRLSGWDATIFLGCLPVLLDNAPSATPALRQDLRQAIHQVWDTYFPMGEVMDVAFYMGAMLHGMAFFEEALYFFEESLRLYGRDARTLYNMALCHYGRKSWETALDYIGQTLALDPDFEQAMKLQAKIQEQSGRD
jgi:tetratricopeptide (TPR) repeat protein